MCNGLFLLQDDETDGHHSQQGGNGNHSVSHFLEPHQTNGGPNNKQSAPGWLPVVFQKKLVQQISRNQANDDTENNGDGYAGQLPGDVHLVTTIHTQKDGKEDDNEDVVNGRCRQNHGGNALFGSFAPLHEINHQRHHHSRRDRCQNAAQNGGFEEGDFQEVRRHCHDCRNFKNGRPSRHDDRCFTHPMQGVAPQLESGPQKDHNQSNPAKVSRNLHHLWPHQTYNMRSHQNPDDKHANQTRKLELAKQDIRCQAKDYDQRQACCHINPPRIMKPSKPKSDGTLQSHPM